MTSTHSKMDHHSRVKLNTFFDEIIDSPVVRESIEKFVPSLFLEKGKNIEFVLNLLHNDPKNASLSFVKDDDLHTFKIEGLTKDQVKLYKPYGLAHIRFLENDKDKNYDFLKKK